MTDQIHRAVHAAEHDPENGRLHGFCLLCGILYPCEYIGPPPDKLIQARVHAFEEAARLVESFGNRCGWSGEAVAHGAADSIRELCSGEVAAKEHWVAFNAAEERASEYKARAERAEAVLKELRYVDEHRCATGCCGHHTAGICSKTLAGELRRVAVLARSKEAADG